MQKGKKIAQNDRWKNKHQNSNSISRELQMPSQNKKKFNKKEHQQIHFSLHWNSALCAMFAEFLLLLFCFFLHRAISDSIVHVNTFYSLNFFGCLFSFYSIRFLENICTRASHVVLISFLFGGLLCLLFLCACRNNYSSFFFWVYNQILIACVLKCEISLKPLKIKDPFGYQTSNQKY